MAQTSSNRRSVELLRGLDPFDRLPVPALHSAAAAVRWPRVPAGRWLVRPGRALSDFLYLLEGRVRLQADRHVSVVGGGSRRARRPVYPGAGAVITLTACRFAAVDAAVMSRARSAAEGRAPARPFAGPEARRAEAQPGLPLLVAAAESWQGRFLASPLLQRLSPPAWQVLLRTLEPFEFADGDWLIRAGAAADGCYVLQSGRVEIKSAAGARLALLGPGRLFGEDALVTGRRRNASAVARGPGVAAFMPAAAFRDWLLDAVVAPLASAGDRVVLSLDRAAPSAVHVALVDIRGAAGRLSRRDRFAVAGATGLDRALAALLLAEQGIDAQPLA